MTKIKKMPENIGKNAGIVYSIGSFYIAIRTVVMAFLLLSCAQSYHSVEGRVNQCGAKEENPQSWSSVSFVRSL
jgi:hypothetical protein